MELMLTYCIGNLNCKIHSIEIQDLNVLKLHIFFIHAKVASTNLKVYIHEVSSITSSQTTVLSQQVKESQCESYMGQ